MHLLYVELTYLAPPGIRVKEAKMADAGSITNK
jgi:hypothetical protein